MLESRALRGAVAQLGERRVRNAKVEGSIPFRSTNSLFLDDPKWFHPQQGYRLGVSSTDDPP